MSDVTSRPGEVTNQEITECERERENSKTRIALVLYSTILSLAHNYDIYDK